MGATIPGTHTRIHRVSRGPGKESQRSLREFKMLRPERVSRARNEDSCEFLNSYGTLNAHRVSQRCPVDSALPVPEPGAEAILDH